MRPKNEPIGEVECPVKGCTQVCQVYRFRQRVPGRSRFAGKVYAECGVHGRYGADGKQASQDYILEKGRIWHTEDRPVPVPAAPAVPARPAAPAPVPARAPAAPAAPASWKPPKPLIDIED